MAVELKEREPEKTIINLPIDAEQREKLERKYLKYLDREKKFKDRFKKATDVGEQVQLLNVVHDTYYKSTVLGTLLQKGTVDSKELEDEIREIEGTGFDIESFENAIGVIEGYATGNLEEIKGGTGLE